MPLTLKVAMFSLVPTIFNGSVWEVRWRSLFSMYEFWSSVSARVFSWAGELCWGSGQEFPAASHLSVFGSESLTFFFSFGFSNDLLLRFGASSSMGMFEVSWFIALFVRAHHKEALIPPYHWG